MVLKSVGDAVDTLRSCPAFWFAGLIISALSVLQFWLSMTGLTFYAERLLILQGLILPFVIAGAYGALLSGETGIVSFFKAGARWYFRLLLPFLLIIAAIAITFLAVLVPLMLFGYGLDNPLIAFVLFTVSFSVVFFTFFYDTAAVFEDRRIMDSLRRSVEVVLLNPFKTLFFYLSVFTYTLIVVFAGIIVWSMLLASDLEPLMGMTTAELEVLTPADILALLGTQGMIITAVLYFLGMVLLTSSIYAFKAAFFRRYASVGRPTPEAEPDGAYDEKGRWYKYS